MGVSNHMIQSMTGFGQASGNHASGKWVVEIRSWNHRFFDCSLRTPGFLSGLEDEIKDLIHRKVKRGKIAVSIILKSKNASSNGMVLNETKVGTYVRTLRKIQKQYKLSDEPIRIESLLQIPSLFIVEDSEKSVEESWAYLKKLIVLACEKLLLMKVKEGKSLGLELGKRTRLLAQETQEIEQVKQKLPAERLARFKERVGELGKGLSFDVPRLEQEIVLFVDRSDITEEVVRIQHHLGQFEKSLNETGEVGKKLDFIAQELGREVNTIASKSQSSEISSVVVRMKAELDKIREQVQNVE